MFCAKCGNLIHDGAKFCANCGKLVDVVQVEVSKIEKQETTSSSKDKCVSSDALPTSLYWIIWLFYGGFACGVVSYTISSTPFWSSASNFIEYVAVTAAFVLLTAYIIKGARWARIACYIFVSFMLLRIAVGLFSGDTFTTIFGDGGIVCCVFGLLSLISLVAGSVLLLSSNIDVIFPKGKEASKNGLTACLVFLALFFVGMIALSARPNPPISASFKPSYLGESRESVLEIANTTDRGVMVKIHRNEIGTNSPKFFIKPGEQREFGSQQIGSNFFPGQTGYIEVEGYEKKLHFSNNGKTYETWFDF